MNWHAFFGFIGLLVSLLTVSALWSAATIWAAEKWGYVRSIAISAALMVLAAATYVGMP